MSNNDVQTNRVELNLKDVRGAFWRWMFFCHSCYNYELYQGMGITHALSKAMSKLYPNRAQLGKELSKHTIFFNSATHTGSIIHGAVLAMEEERANGAEEITPELINSIKSGLMGPLAGLGDSLVQGVMVPILLALGITLTESLGVAGPLIYTALISIVVLGLAYVFWMQGYKLGTEAIGKIINSGLMKNILGAAGILGCIVLGGLVSNYVSITTSVYLPLSTGNFVLQTNFLDKLMPNLLSLATTMGVYGLVRKGVKSNKILLGLFIIGAILGFLGILGPVPVFE